MSQDQKTQDLHENVGFYTQQWQRNKKTAQEQTGQEEKAACAKPAEGFCLSGRIPQVSHPIIIIIRSV